MAATPMDRSSFQYPFWRLLRLATSAILPFVWIACKDRPWIWLLHDVLSAFFTPSLLLALFSGLRFSPQRSRERMAALRFLTSQERPARLATL